MGIKCGFVGLPNVGKSTLFNSLTQSIVAQAENYPFCTIEPNISEVLVPDDRLDEIAKIAKSAKIIPTSINFIDIAGIVKGASKGEGLGNQFLANIREVDAIIYICRCFEDENITHVSGKVDPIADIEVIKTELIIADLESINKRIVNLRKKVTGNDKEAKIIVPIMEKILKTLEEGHEARFTDLSKEETEMARKFNLLTTKPILYVANVDENAVGGNEFTALLEKYVNGVNDKFGTNDTMLIISARMEEDIIQLDKEEREEYLAELGVKNSGLEKIIKHAYDLLGLSTYFTAGPKETRAWTIPKNCPAPKAAGVIHTDFERGFIKAETISYDNYIKCNGYNGAKEAGKLELNGKEYIVKDGDVILFRFNV